MLLGSVLLLPALVLAAVFTAAQIADAVRASSRASAWLRANADAIGALAVRVESGGSTTAYNGSCCYGVLQMNAANVAYYTGKSPSQYLAMSLQDQVDAWSALTSDALSSSTVTRLTSMSSFDGRPVNAYLVLACVQLGTGNCNKMLNSGSCSGFADNNGTTICRMADQMAGTSNGSGSSSAGTGSSGDSTSGLAPAGGCSVGADGACLPIAEAMQQGFAAGAGGVSMPMLRASLLVAVCAGVLLIAAGLAAGTWGQYQGGGITAHELVRTMVKIALIVTIALAITARI